MKVRIDGGKIVTLKHFRVCSSHMALLKNLQIEVENIDLLAEGPDGRPMIVRAFQLHLEPHEIRMLNAEVYS